ncbi:unnamed protein product [Callosobruchus maculatus]|uniref:Uncharacterized protein n=1 Tax=Callosobruchus maculatus TaxID=64391 RepID=A0A653CRT7_CALMS|nr:unnamed protein product [Callosobruchus maculatus]
MFEIQCPNFPKLKLSVYSLERELKRIDKHVDLINKLKDRTIVILEEKKLNFRKYITIPKIYEEVKNEERRLVPVTVIERIISIIDKINMLGEEIDQLLEEVKNESELSDLKLAREPFDQTIPGDISGIQNKYDLIIGDLRDMKENIEERIKIVEQTELIMNLLHYRMYEIRYDFTMKLNQLTQQKADLKTGMMLKETESQAAFKIIETEKEITECQNNFSNLLLLLEAEKAIIEDKKYSLEDVKNVIALEDIEAVMDKFTEMQTEGWKTRAVDNISGNLVICFQYMCEITSRKCEKLTQIAE